MVNKNKGNKTISDYIKFISGMLILTLSINFIIYPVMAQTIEEDAGKKYKGTPYQDEFDKKAKDRFVIWLIPSASKNIYGIAIGPVGSEAICNRHYTKYSHGLNLQIPGQGFFQTFYINKMRFKDFYANENSDSLSLQNTFPKRAIHNGLIISPLGTFTDQVNGISFSLWMSMGKKINGLSFNLLWNLYEQIIRTNKWNNNWIR